MKKTLLSLVITVLLSIVFVAANAQNKHYTIKGQVQDTSTFMFVTNSSVVIINQSDSMLQGYTRAKEDGTFSLKVSAPTTYILMISHPNFATQLQEINITDSITDLGMIEMVSKRILLEEAIISGERAITIKGDTVEYAADSFRVRDFDNVDELLKRLPGIEVTKDGTIKAHGEKVQKMFVDGEEFFSDDPAILAKTLRASAVDKVQVYDGKTEQAEFSGVDDGERVKTINLKLKDNAKKGYFGKVGAGAAPQGYYEGEAMINAFKDKRKMALYSIGANTNKVGLNWGDNSSFGSGGSGEMTINEDGNFENSYDEFSFGTFNGNGLPRTLNMGGFYNNKWKDNKYAFNGSYRYVNNGVNNIENTVTQYILPDTQYFEYKNNESKSNNLRHNITTRTEIKIDSLTTLRINASGALRNTKSLTNSQSNAEDLLGNLINKTSRESDRESDNKDFNFNVDFRKRFKKVGRTFTINFSGKIGESESNNNLTSTNDLFALDTSFTIRQNTLNTSNNNRLGTRISYTEPIWKEIVFWESNYSLVHSSNKTINATYDLLPGTDEMVYNNIFSSNYQFDVLTNRAGTALRVSKGKINANTGVDVAYAQFTQLDLREDTSFSYNRLNFFPRANISYKHTKQSTYNFSYRGATRQPTISQIQPIVYNSDPMNLYIGNPDLKQQVTHNLNLNFNNYAVLTNRYFYTSFYYTITQNAISQAQVVDEAGRRTYQNINVNGNQHFNAYVNYSKRIIENLTGNFYANGSYTLDNNYVNNIKNKNDRYNISPNFGVNYKKDTLFHFNYSFNPVYNISNNSVRKDLSVRYWSYNQDFDFEYNLPYGIRVGTVIEWLVRQRVNPNEPDNNVFLWNVYASKSFLKDRSLEAKIYGYDILNQNVGYYRYQSAEMVNENTFNIIKRYLMISLVWNFTHTANLDGSKHEGDAPKRSNTTFRTYRMR